MWWILLSVLVVLGLLAYLFLGRHPEAVASHALGDPRDVPEPHPEPHVD